MIGVSTPAELQRAERCDNSDLSLSGAGGGCVCVCVYGMLLGAWCVPHRFIPARGRLQSGRRRYIDL